MAGSNRSTANAKRTLASAAPSSLKVRKELSKENVRFLANMPAAVVTAYNVLVDYGVDPVKLCKLIEKRTRPRGRPSNAEQTARLISTVERYWQDHPEVTTAKEAIAKTVEGQESFKRLSRTQQDAKKRSLEVAFSSAVATRKARGSESMDEYAARRKREMRSDAQSQKPPEI